jgi:hypothetical protein
MASGTLPLLAFALAAAAPAIARVREPAVHPTLPWLVAQLIPSPGVAAGEDGAELDLRWQLTPLLYSFGVDPRLSPWRFFVVEPIVRQSGSIEVFFSPEYLAIPAEFGDRFGFRAGMRSYFPLLHRGDYLSASVGSSYYRFAFHDGASYEAGIYVLFGMLGLQAQFSPGFSEATVISTFALRIF